MNRIFKKILFTSHIASLGADFKSKYTLFTESIRIQKNLYTKGEARPFSCKIKNNGKSAEVYFRGILDEMHALTEIFIDRCYDPKTKDVKTILDLGANSGLASVWFWLEFPESKIHAYEPDPEVYKILDKNLHNLSGATSFNVAVSDKESSMKFYVSERSFSSSLYQVPESKTINVPTKTLDQAIDKIGGSIDLLKIDIEGAEFDVIKNSKKLNDIKTIIGEAHPEKANRETLELTTNLSKTHKIKNVGIGKSLFFAEKLN